MPQENIKVSVEDYSFQKTRQQDAIELPNKAMQHRVLLMSAIVFFSLLLVSLMLYRLVQRHINQKYENEFILKSFMGDKSLKDPCKLAVHASTQTKSILAIHSQYLQFNRDSQRICNVTSSLVFWADSMTLQSSSKLENTLPEFVQEILEIRTKGVIVRTALTGIELKQLSACIRQHTQTVTDMLICLDDETTKLYDMMHKITKTIELHLRNGTIQFQDEKEWRYLLRSIQWNSGESEPDTLNLKFISKSYQTLKEQEQLTKSLGRIMERLHCEKNWIIGKEEIDDTVSQWGPSSGGRRHSSVILTTHKLQNLVDRAEDLQLTHLDEVIQAQELMQHIKYEQLCTALCSKDSSSGDTVVTLKNYFIALGAKESDAVLKAGEIHANRSNTMLLVSTLRTVFEEWRKYDLKKLEERRRRDELRQVQRREVLKTKFRLRRQLLQEKIQLQQEKHKKQLKAEQERKFYEQLAIEKEELILHVRQIINWITKVDVMIVLLAVFFVFSDRILQYVHIDLTCGSDFNREFAWTQPFHQISTIKCYIWNTIQITGLILCMVLFLIVCTQITAVKYLFPCVLVGVLYQMRMEWLNMLLRSPLVLLIYFGNQYVHSRIKKEVTDMKFDYSNTQDPFPQRVRPQLRKTVQMMLYCIYPLMSGIVSAQLSMIIACDHPQECAKAAWSFTWSTAHDVVELCRKAYHV
uniref:Uncharacterized protein AlNc14C35G3139 n=1 Tax=Albugo laibachii Nc14 TaxID=890382 RepID=F0W8L3_9STRA|nr:conserved hypothetical protein [Albugo laibachii Nc14]|eukprot:CCA17468.1 conserved hypothetical protein [Albugo laibachii Nc14]